MTDIVVGCPTQNRSWILPLWRDYVTEAVPEDWNLQFVLAVPSWDEETIALADWATIVPLDESEKDDSRKWRWNNTDVYYHMAHIRNELLRTVRTIKPDVFLSLDSDILIHPNAIVEMYETMMANKADAVGGLTYLDPIDPTVTSLATWSDPATCTMFQRCTAPGQHPIDIIMAIQMMGNLAYNVNYEHNILGEDFGWAKSLKRAGAKIFCDGRSASKHVMDPKWLDIIDKRVGY